MYEAEQKGSLNRWSRMQPGCPAAAAVAAAGTAAVDTLLAIVLFFNII